MLSIVKPRLLPGFLAIALGYLACFPGITTGQHQRSDFVSDASFTIATYQPAENDYSPQAQSAAAQAFLVSLDDHSRDSVTHALDSPERKNWTNLPAQPNAGGIPLGQLNQDQVKRACDLMATLLSKRGYEKFRSIMLADDQLLPNGRPRPGFGTETFSIVLFGNPTANKPWAFQLDGHHIGVNIAINGPDMTLSPSFIGTQPESFKIAGSKFRPLSGEIDKAFELTGSLSEQQFRKALINGKRGQIKTGPGADGLVPPAQGISAKELDPSQRATLLALISQWLHNLPKAHADKRMKQIQDELDQIKFAWSGPREPSSDVSFAIQGPSLIIEYACQDLGGNPMDHLHSMYRNPTNEYGGQLK